MDQPQNTPYSQNATPPTLPGRVMVMPAYYLPRVKKSLSMTAIIAMIVGAVVVIAAIVVVVLLANRPPAAVTPAPEEIVEPTPEPTTPTPETPVEVEPVPAETPSTVVLPEPRGTPLASDTDTDQDGLTDTEEQMFLTSPSVPDTDSDSFLDGNELKSLYDPATPRALLEVSPQVKLARNEAFGYQLLIPAAWIASKNTSDGSQFIIRPATGSESFRLDVYLNEDRLSVTDWYQQEASRPDLTQFVNFSNEAGWTGIQTTDHSLVIATLETAGAGSRAFIFVMSYDAGQESVLRYRAVWDMITNSLAPLVAPIPQ